MLGNKDYCSSVLDLLRFTESLRSVYVAVCVINGIFSVIAMACNIVIILAITRKRFALRTPSFVLLCTMAISDLGVGLVVQPLYILRKLLELYNISRYYCSLSLAFHLSSSFFAALTFLTIAAMSVDRYLAVRLCATYKPRVTFKKTVMASLLLICFAAIYAVTYVLSVLAFYVLTVLILPVCLITATTLYVKVYRLIQKHERKFRRNKNTPDSNSKQENRTVVAGYKKAVNTMVCIFCIFLLCYVPFFAASIALVIRGHQTYVLAAHHITATFVFINSSINPILFYWRMPEINRAVKQILYLN